MFEKIKDFMKGVRYQMFPIANINAALGVKSVTSSRMTAAIETWAAMQRGGGLQLPASIAAELARLATIECNITLSGTRAALVTDAFASVLRRLRTQTEFGIALGGLILKPYLDGKTLAVEFTHADSFYPIAFDGSGKLLAVVFMETITRGSKIYRRLEYHHMEKDGCVIENKAFVIDAVQGDAMLGKPIPLGAVEEWARLEAKITIANVRQLLLGYFKMPLANTIEARSPLGVSAYARAADLIWQADAQWERILWEFEGTELAIHADATLMGKDADGKICLPKGKERLYRTLPGLEDKLLPFSPAIRDMPLFNGFNNMLKRIEFQCGLAYGTLSDPQNVEKTAEEIKASKQRSYSMVKDIQKALQTALDDLLYAMDTWMALAAPAGSGATTASYDWDDSIIADPSERKKLFWQYVSSGKFPMWRYLMDFEGYGEADAKAIVAESGGDAADPFGGS